MFQRFDGLLAAPRAGNLDIPIGILMVLRCSGPPRSHKNAGWH